MLREQSEHSESTLRAIRKQSDCIIPLEPKIFCLVVFGPNFGPDLSGGRARNSSANAEIDETPV